MESCPICGDELLHGVCLTCDPQGLAGAQPEDLAAQYEAEEEAEMDELCAQVDLADQKLIAAGIDPGDHRPRRMRHLASIMRDKITESLNEKDVCWHDWAPSYEIDKLIDELADLTD